MANSQTPSLTDYGIPIRNIWHMLLYAWNEVPLNAVHGWILAEAERAPTLDVLLSSVLIKLMQQRLRIGLGHDYVGDEQKAPGVRGRIKFAESLKQRTLDQGQLICEFQAYNANSPRNQIIRTSLARLMKVGHFGPDAASVNADAPIICCTAEILANLALREGSTADIGLVVMDEFHFYAEPDRGWAWQVPLLELPQAQFLLMSATLGDVSAISEDLTRRTGRETTLVDGAERPIPLHFTWSLTPMAEALEELVATKQAPVYVVHFTQKDAVEHATSLLKARLPVSAETKQRIAERIAEVRFGAGFGKTLSQLLKAGIGVHHAGMLPLHKELVERLSGACSIDRETAGRDVAAFLEQLRRHRLLAD